MVLSNQLTSGMIIIVDKELYKVVSSMKVSLPKGDSYIRATLKKIGSEDTSEKNFKIGQELKEVHPESRTLECLYSENDSFLFLDLFDYEKRFISSASLKDKIFFLKAGVQVTALVYQDNVFSVELPYFLELMVSKADFPGEDFSLAGGQKNAILETGATIQVPGFIEIGDIIKVDTRTCEYIQRV